MLSYDSRSTLIDWITEKKVVEIGRLLDNEAIELEFISVLIYYTYMRKLEKEENMMCRNDKGRVDPKWKTQHVSKSHPSRLNIFPSSVMSK